MTACPRPDKVAYPSEATAHAWFADLEAREGEAFNVYLCRCGAWHGGRVAVDRELHLVAVRTFGPALDLTIAGHLDDAIRVRIEALVDT